MSDEEINISFGTSKAFAPHVAAVVASIVRHAKGARFRFIILHEGIPLERRKLIEATAPGASFHWVEVTDDDVPPYVDRAHFSRPILYRLGLEKLAPADCHRVLYLDADVILMRNVQELWNIDLAGAPLGAIMDSFVKPQEFAERWGLPWSSIGYFNSGVLLIDLTRVRAEGLFQAAIAFAAKHAHACYYADQDALNFVAWGRWKPLPPTWNAQHDMVVPWMADQLPEELRFHNRLPALVQFTGPEKPWVRDLYHPWAWIYWDNLSRTPFSAEVAATYGFSLFQRFRLWLRWVRRRPKPSLS